MHTTVDIGASRVAPYFLTSIPFFIDRIPIQLQLHIACLSFHSFVNLVNLVGNGAVLGHDVPKRTQPLEFF